MTSAATLMPARREKNGRMQRPKKMTLEQIAAADREQRLKETAAVRGQPHRRNLPDPASDKAHSNLGRFCDFFELPIEFYWAGEKYREAVNCWRAAKKLKHHKSGDGDGKDKTLAEQAKAIDDARAFMLECDVAMYRASPPIYNATRAVCIEDISVTTGDASKVEDGLYTLAIHFGMLKRPVESPRKPKIIEPILLTAHRKSANA